MPRDLFGEVTRPSITIGRRKWYTLPLSLLTHSCALALLFAAPILAPSMMPEVWRGDVIAYMTKVLPPPPPAPPVRPDVRKRPAVDPNAAPIEAPTGVTKEPATLPVFETDQPVGDGFVAGVTDHRLFEPAPLQPSAPVEPIRVGGSIRPPLKIRDARPVYPSMAIAARIEGVVIIDATIGADGRVLDVRLLRSAPFLDEAALDAVRQWQFTPTLLNGVPVPVLMTVTVRFTLKPG